jgi:tryptophan-rich sensory protein
MSELALPGQLRAAFFRWALVLVPGLLMLGFFSGLVADSGPGNPWFDDLVKPEIYPPAEVFGIVWSILYVLMGLALAMIAAARRARGRGIAIAVFVLQFVISLVWSPLFFGAHQITLALVLIGVLALLVLVTILLFRKIRPLAAWLLVPYLAWVLFASLLNYEFLRANPDADGRINSGAATRVVI